MKKLTCTVLVLAMVFCLSVSASAAPMKLVDSVSYTGKITEIDQGRITMETVFEGKSSSQVLLISENTVFLDGHTGQTVEATTLKAGDAITAFASPISTMSLPPQSPCYAIVSNVQESDHYPNLMIAGKVSRNKNSIMVMSKDGDLVVALSDSISIIDAKTGDPLTLSDIHPGTMFIAWYDLVQETYPAQASAFRAAVISDKLDPASVSSITVEGDMALSGKTEARNGLIMVPLREVAEAMGYTVTWDDQARTASLDNGQVKTTVTLGTDAYYLASSKAIGLTQNFSYGAAPELVDGKTYVPVQLFLLLNSDPDSVEYSGATVNFK